MQKIVNGLAIFSSLVSLSVVGAGGYVYLQKDALIDGVKGQLINGVTDAVTGQLPGMMDSALPELPGATGGAIPGVGGGGGLGLPF